MSTECSTHSGWLTDPGVGDLKILGFITGKDGKLYPNFVAGPLSEPPHHEGVAAAAVERREEGAA